VLQCVAVCCSVLQRAYVALSASPAQTQTQTQTHIHTEREIHTHMRLTHMQTQAQTQTDTHTETKTATHAHMHTHRHTLHTHTFNLFKSMYPLFHFMNIKLFYCIHIRYRCNNILFYAYVTTTLLTWHTYMHESLHMAHIHA